MLYVCVCAPTNDGTPTVCAHPPAQLTWALDGLADMDQARWKREYHEERIKGPSRFSLDHPFVVSPLSPTPSHCARVSSSAGTVGGQKMELNTSGWIAKARVLQGHESAAAGASCRPLVLLILPPSQSLPSGYALWQSASNFCWPTHASTQHKTNPKGPD